MSEFTDTIERNTPEDYPHLVCGWPDEKHGITWYAYCDWAKDLIDELEEGSSIGTFQTFQEWKEMKRDEDEERDNLGFCREECDLCGALAGDRYAVTALPDNPAINRDYVALEVCNLCIMWIANGQEPDEEWP